MIVYMNSKPRGKERLEDWQKIEAPVNLTAMRIARALRAASYEEKVPMRGYWCTIRTSQAGSHDGNSGTLSFSCRSATIAHSSTYVS